MTFNPGLGAQYDSFDNAWDKARQQRLQNAQLFTKMIDDAAARGVKLTPADAQKMMYDLAGNDGYMQGAFPAGQALQSYLSSQNKAADAATFQQQLADLDGKNKMQQYAKDAIKDAGYDRDKWHGALVDRFGQQIGDQMFLANSKFYDNWSSQMLDNEVTSALQNPKFDELTSPADIPQAYPYISPQAQEALKPYVIRNLQKQQQARADANAGREFQQRQANEQAYWGYMNNAATMAQQTGLPFDPIAASSAASAIANGFSPPANAVSAWSQHQAPFIAAGQNKVAAATAATISQDPAIVQALNVQDRGSFDNLVKQYYIAARGTPPTKPELDNLYAEARNRRIQSIPSTIAGLTAQATKSIDLNEIQRTSADTAEAANNYPFQTPGINDKVAKAAANHLKELSKDYVIPSKEAGIAIREAIANDIGAGVNEQAAVNNAITNFHLKTFNQDATQRVADQVEAGSTFEQQWYGKPWGNFANHYLDKAKAITDSTLLPGATSDVTQAARHNAAVIRQMASTIKNEISLPQSDVLLPPRPDDMSADQLVAALEAQAQRLDSYTYNPAKVGPSFQGSPSEQVGQSVSDMLSTNAQAARQTPYAKAQAIIDDINTWAMAIKSQTGSYGDPFGGLTDAQKSQLIAAKAAEIKQRAASQGVQISEQGLMRLLTNPNTAAADPKTGKLLMDQSYTVPMNLLLYNKIR
jgi:hypothetical protein